MYKLPANFTGYNAQESGVEHFTALCYSLQGLGLINVKETKGYSYPKNYYEATVNDFNEDFTIYMNCYSKVIAFGKINDEMEIYFDKPLLVDAIKSLDPAITIPSKTILSQPITSAHMENLEAFERKELDYWLPCTIGRALYSWYFD